MDFPSIQTNQIMNEMQSSPMVNSTNVRMVTGGNKLDELSGWQKFSLGFRKFGAFFGRIGAKLLSFIPGWGTIASAGLYGISDLADRSYQKSMTNRMNSLAVDEQAAQSNFDMITPGFGQFGTPGLPAGAAPAPSDGLEMQKLDTVLLREGAAKQQISNASFS